MRKINVILLLLTLLVVSACSGGTSSTPVPANSDTDSNAPAPVSGGPEKTDSEEKFVLKAVHAYPASASPQVYYEKFNEIISERSNGRLSLEVFPGAQLMPAVQELPSMLTGQVDMTITTGTVIASIEPSYLIFDLPFLIDHDAKDYSVYMNSMLKFTENEQVGGKIIKSLESHGFKVLANLFTSSPGVLLGREEETFTLDNIKGKKIRVIGGQVMPKTFSNLGASGVSIAAAEVNPALQQGVVDGTMQPIEYAMDTEMPIKSATFVALMSNAVQLIISQSKYESLPPDLQEVLNEASKELEVFSKEYMKEHYDKALLKVEEKGIQTHYPSQEELERWREAVIPVWDELVKVVPSAKEILDAAKAES